MQSFPNNVADELGIEISESAPKPRRGRPFLLGHGRLLSSRDYLVSVLEDIWGTIGWELPRISSAEDVRKAFQSLHREHEQNQALQAIVRENELPVTAAKLNQIRRKLWRVNARVSEAQELREQCRKNLEDAQWAMSSQPAASQVQALERGREKATKAFAAAEEKLVVNRTTQKQFEDEILAGEAYFARHELLRFRQSLRYEINPLNVANALAGLPFIGWRQSFKRCIKVECPQVNGANYQTFIALGRIVKSCPDCNYLSDHAEEWLRRKHPQELYGITEMGKNWYYLRRAIQAVSEQWLDAQRLPFMLLTEYQNRVSHASQPDRTLAKNEEIVP